MIANAKIYENAWVTTNECPAPPDDYPSEDKVVVFLDIFFRPEFFGRIVVWKNSALRNSGDYRMAKKGERHIVIDSLEEATRLKNSFRLSSDQKGHISVFYMPANNALFLNEILKRGHYAQGEPITIGTDEGEYRLRSDGQDVSFLLSDVFCKGEHIFTFSHDAEFLFEIFRD